MLSPEEEKVVDKYMLDKRQASRFLNVKIKTLESWMAKGHVPYLYIRLEGLTMFDKRKLVKLNYAPGGQLAGKVSKKRKLNLDIDCAILSHDRKKEQKMLKPLLEAHKGLDEVYKREQDGDSTLDETDMELAEDRVRELNAEVKRFNEERIRLFFDLAHYDSWEELERRVKYAIEELTKNDVQPSTPGRMFCVTKPDEPSIRLHTFRQMKRDERYFPDEPYYETAGQLWKRMQEVKKEREALSRSV